MSVIVYPVPRYELTLYFVYGSLKALKVLGYSMILGAFANLLDASISFVMSL